MRRPRVPIGTLVLVLCAGVYGRFLWSCMVVRRAEPAARAAGFVAVRMAASPARFGGDAGVTIDSGSPARLSMGERFSLLPAPEGNTWTYRPWRGLRIESYDYRLCSNPGNYLAQVMPGHAHWTVRFSDGAPGACGPPS